jgi:hypothetical protein
VRPPLWFVDRSIRKATYGAYHIVEMSRGRDRLAEMLERFRNRRTGRLAIAIVRYVVRYAAAAAVELGMKLLLQQLFPPKRPAIVRPLRARR